MQRPAAGIVHIRFWLGQLQPWDVDMGCVAEFRLYDGANSRLLGVQESIEDAYAAADEHTLDVLRAAGEWVIVEHLLAWLGADGQLELGSEITHAGPPDDVEACREWLSLLPGRRARSD